jgi:hypothetical protein
MMFLLFSKRKYNFCHYRHSFVFLINTVLHALMQIDFTSVIAPPLVIVCMTLTVSEDPDQNSITLSNICNIVLFLKLLLLCRPKPIPTDQRAFWMLHSFPSSGYLQIMYSCLFFMHCNFVSIFLLLLVHYAPVIIYNVSTLFLQ